MVPVWDPLVRVVHWSMVLAFVVAFLVEDDLMTVHVWAGYVVGALATLRVGWGLIGTRYARFSNFLSPYREVVQHFKELVEFRPRRHLGHSPVAGVMIAALLLSLLGTVVSGIWVYASAHHSGPLAGAIASAPGGMWDTIHETLSGITMLLAALHVIAVILVSWLTRENLVKSMLTGRKRSLDAEAST